MTSSWNDCPICSANLRVTLYSDSLMMRCDKCEYYLEFFRNRFNSQWVVYKENVITNKYVICRYYDIPYYYIVTKVNLYYVELNIPKEIAITKLTDRYIDSLLVLK